MKIKEMKGWEKVRNIKVSNKQDTLKLEGVEKIVALAVIEGLRLSIEIDNIEYGRFDNRLRIEYSNGFTVLKTIKEGDKLPKEVVNKKDKIKIRRRIYV